MDPMKFQAVRRYAVQPDDLWPLIADTNRLNRVIGLRAVAFQHSARTDGGSVVTGEYRILGELVARWTEHPFNFERPRRYSVLREYSVGPILRMSTGVELTPADGGTEVRVFAEVIPRNVLGGLLAKYFIGRASTTRVLGQCKVFETYLLGRRDDAFPQLRAARRSVDERRLDELMGRLFGTGSDPSVLQRLGDHLRFEPDDRVGQMRPFELADRWGVDRHSTLVAFLRSTTVGLLDMRWDVLCPNCRVPKAEYVTLSELQQQAHCETCNITFDANFDRLVEVRFRVSPSVRKAGSDLFCIGGPQNQPHVVAQAELEPASSAVWAAPSRAMTLRLRSPQSTGAALVEVIGDGDAGTVLASLGLERGAITPAAVIVPSGAGTIEVTNRTDARVIAILEEQVWATTAATAALVSTLQEFRDLCSSEVLAPGLQVGIERLALLFTDLSGSTELYERIGQARAFRLVQDHFVLVDGAVREHRGAVVKTIGDAVMAAFPTGADAMGAAVAMQWSMRSLEGRDGLDASRLLKVGIHAGPCLVVTLNNRLDYFGTTVNTAARAQHEAEGGEIVVTQDVRVEPGVSEVMAAAGVSEQTSEIALRGLAEPVRIFRLRSLTGWGDAR